MSMSNIIGGQGDVKLPREISPFKAKTPTTGGVHVHFPNLPEQAELPPEGSRLHLWLRPSSKAVGVVQSTFDSLKTSRPPPGFPPKGEVASPSTSPASRPMLKAPSPVRTFRSTLTEPTPPGAAPVSSPQRVASVPAQQSFPPTSPQLNLPFPAVVPPPPPPGQREIPKPSLPPVTAPPPPQAGNLFEKAVGTTGQDPFSKASEEIMSALLTMPDSVQFVNLLLKQEMGRGVSGRTLFQQLSDQLDKAGFTFEQKDEFLRQCDFGALRRVRFAPTAQQMIAPKEEVLDSFIEGVIGEYLDGTEPNPEKVIEEFEADIRTRGKALPIIGSANLDTETAAELKQAYHRYQNRNALLNSIPQMIREFPNNAAGNYKLISTLANYCQLIDPALNTLTLIHKLDLTDEAIQWIEQAYTSYTVIKPEIDQIKNLISVYRNEEELASQLVKTFGLSKAYELLVISNLPEKKKQSLLTILNEGILSTFSQSDKTSVEEIRSSELSSTIKEHLVDFIHRQHILSLHLKYRDKAQNEALISELGRYAKAQGTDSLTLIQNANLDLATKERLLTAHDDAVLKSLLPRYLDDDEGNYRLISELKTYCLDRKLNSTSIILQSSLDEPTRKRFLDAHDQFILRELLENFPNNHQGNYGLISQLNDYIRVKSKLTRTPISAASLIESSHTGKARLLQALKIYTYMKSHMDHIGEYLPKYPPDAVNTFQLACNIVNYAKEVEISPFALIGLLPISDERRTAILHSIDRYMIKQALLDYPDPKDNNTLISTLETYLKERQSFFEQPRITNVLSLVEHFQYIDNVDKPHLDKEKTKVAKERLTAAYQAL